LRLMMYHEHEKLAAVQEHSQAIGDGWIIRV
jgi:hypothetical protein